MPNHQRIEQIAISDCMHYRGFRYGGYGHNPYEDYILGLRNHRPARELRLELTARVLSLAGNTWGAVLNTPFIRNSRAWDFPWNWRRALPVRELSPQDNTDVICHYSPQGVLASHLNREFFWLERAYAALAGGYQPERYGHVQLLSLVNGEKRRYIVLDGNHRVAAMHAHGVTHFAGACSRVGMRNRRYARIWPGVLRRQILLADALRIFDRYFANANVPLPSKPQLPLISDTPLNLEGVPLPPDL